MTEREWLENGRIGPLIFYVENKGSERKLRLFAHACCRRIEHLLIDHRSLAALAALENFIEGKCAKEELEHHYRQAGEAVKAIEAP